ncbi:site-2 protease family protein [Motilimonas sp. 1_MG-2023]|uniref:site-2 protease family protein n=1 Tax=Motilimonas TaxID=1914248 RepID=UPI0026E29D0C|nr:site-2 protease family protein [Motilimonas sp. 1_MG-2023]MDO6526423.1 site-2 protease family protein [Motilimonas sp. 1_MG-2023]
MELLHLHFFDKPLRLEGSTSGEQKLFWNEVLVSQSPAIDGSKRQFIHTFQLQKAATDEAEPSSIDAIEVKLEIDLTWQPFRLVYCLSHNDVIDAQGERTERDIERQQVSQPIVVERKWSTLGLMSLGFKLFKSAKLIKVALAGASLAAYSWLFSLQFALALLACLVFHEYGHIRAMKYFGMKTKGIYLIPFLGGLALSDEKINTRWQDVVISIMGPFFGLIMSIACLVAYWVTGNIFFAGLAAFNSLLNLFNLLPVLPLDGGHILKSISFSMNTKVGLIACLAGAGLGVWVSYSFGLALLGFLLLIGSIEILLEWRMRHQSHLLPLNRYAQTVSLVWYVATVAAFVSIIWHLAGTGDAMLGLPLQILSS